jgi:hypothetical protein
MPPLAAFTTIAPRGKHGNCSCIEEVVGLPCFGCVKTQKCADSEQIIGVIVEYRVSFNFGRQAMRIVVVDLDPKTASAFCNRDWASGEALACQ